MSSNKWLVVSNVTSAFFTRHLILRCERFPPCAFYVWSRGRSSITLTWSTPHPPGVCICSTPTRSSTSLRVCSAGSSTGPWSLTSVSAPPFIAAIFLSVYCAETKTSASYFCGDVIRAVTSEGGVVLCAAAVRNSKFNFRSVKEV